MRTRTGRPTGRPRVPLRERLEQRILVGPSGCWLVPTRHPDGYARIAEGGTGGRMLMAHRVSYEYFVGPIPEGLTLDHLCRVHNCVNPEHLEPVTQRVNILRGFGAAATNARKTHCPQGHEYTPENTYRDEGRRVCRICKREGVQRCRRAHLSERAAYMRKRRGMDTSLEDPRHGTSNGYFNLGCRCEPCRDAGRRYRTQERAA